MPVSRKRQMPENPRAGVPGETSHQIAPKFGGTFLQVIPGVIVGRATRGSELHQQKKQTNEGTRMLSVAEGGGTPG